jgi:hypothetical protein
MSDAVVCHGTRLFGQVLPPFVLAEGGLMIVKTHTVTRQAEYARLLFCEALCETGGRSGGAQASPGAGSGPLEGLACADDASDRSQTIAGIFDQRCDSLSWR